MLIIGLISGTSADGIDAALCRITGEPGALDVQVLNARTISYAVPLRARILGAMTRVDAPEITRLNMDIGEAFADAANQLIAQSGIIDSIDLIASHGQTIWHEVRPDGRVHGTTQLGSAAVIAERSGITTISNFRARDIAVGGQGAPLTAYVDWLLLRHPTGWRALQNIGGIGNVTLLPPLSDSVSAPMAFDTGPGNALIDAAITLLTDGAQTYDRDGALAAQGAIDDRWLETLLQHPYYAQRPPKSTGRELFSAAMASQVIGEGQRRGMSTPDIIATLTALTAHSIADAYRRFAPAPLGEVVLSGGGARNPVLVAHLRSLLAAPVVLSGAIGIDSNQKEAVAFAVLGYESLHLRPGTHPTLTGARTPALLGDWTPGANFVSLMRQILC